MVSTDEGNRDGSALFANGRTRTGLTDDLQAEMVPMLEGRYRCM